MMEFGIVAIHPTRLFVAFRCGWDKLRFRTADNGQSEHEDLIVLRQDDAADDFLSVEKK